MSSKYIIFGQERSGTTSLISALNFNNNVVHEPLSSLSGDIYHNPKFNSIIEDLGMKPEDLPKSKIIPYFNKFNEVSTNHYKLSSFLDIIYEKFDGIKHVWCTVPQEGNENVIDYCKSRGIKVIYQYRNSFFDAAVSWQLANQVQVWQLGCNKEHKSKVDSFQYIDLQEIPIQRRVKWYKEYLPHYYSLLPDGSFISKYEDLYGLRTYEERLIQFNKIVDYLQIEVDPNNVSNFLDIDRKVFGNKAYNKISNYKEMFDKYGSDKVIL